MGYLNDAGVTALWSKIKATFGAKIAISGVTITLKNKSDSEDILSQATLPNATTSAAGVMSAADKTKLDGIATGATKVTVDSSLSSTSANPVQNKIIDSALADKADLASPTFTGTPKAPTAAAGTNTTQIATTAFVATAVANSAVGAAMFQGAVSSNDTISNSAYKKGWYWTVGKAGTYVGEECEVGDMIFANSDKGSAYNTAHFDVVQNNIQAIKTEELESLLV